MRRCGGALVIRPGPPVPLLDSRSLLAPLSMSSSAPCIQVLLEYLEAVSEAQAQLERSWHARAARSRGPASSLSLWRREYGALS